jgi:hypothetical protein
MNVLSHWDFYIRKPQRIKLTPHAKANYKLMKRVEREMAEEEGVAAFDKWYVNLIFRCPNELTYDEVKFILCDPKTGRYRYHAAPRAMLYPLRNRLCPNLYKGEKGAFVELQNWRSVGAWDVRDNPTVVDPYLEFLINRHPRKLTKEEKQKLLYKSNGVPRRFIYWETGKLHTEDEAIPLIEKLLPKNVTYNRLISLLVFYGRGTKAGDYPCSHKEYYENNRVSAI